MPSGFSAGFAKGLADVLKTTREQELKTESERATRSLQANLAILGPAIQAGIESGDYSVAERVLTEINPEFAKRFKKEGSPFASLGPVFAEQAALESSRAARPGGARGAGVTEGVVTEELMGPPRPGTPPIVAEETVETTLPRRGAQPAGRQPTLFGQPFGISPEERRTRAREGAIDDELVQFDVRRRAAAQQGLDPGSPEYLDFVLYGSRPPASSQAQTPKLGTVEDFMTRKATELGRPPSASDVAIWRTEWEGMNDPDRSPALGSFEDYVARYAQDRGVEPGALSAQQIEEARQRYTAAGRELKDGGNSAGDLAVMAAESPDILQGLTPTLVGGVMQSIAANPVLRRRYEQTRLEPIRAQADTIVTTLNELLDVDDATGEVAGLSDGAAALYGAGLDRAARFIPGTEAANAKAALDQITGQLVLNTLADMKAQSRTGATGFGQLSTRELDVIESAATMLKGEISEALALQKLKALRDKFQLVLEDSAAETGGVAPRTREEDPTEEVIIDLDTPLYLGPDGRYTNTPPGAP